MAADPNYDPTEFQEVLHDWLERNSLSQMAAAQTIGISQGVLNRWLKPRGDPYLVQPSIDSLEKLVPYLRGYTLIDLKRMTGNLSPNDAAAQPAVRRDHRLAALLADIEAQWHDLDPEAKQQAEDVTRILFRMHHRQGRQQRHNRGKPQEDSGSRVLLTVG